MITKTPACNTCVHLNENDLLNMHPTCKAFKEGIPEIIWSGENNHSEPLPDQGNDIVFEEKGDDE